MRQIELCANLGDMDFSAFSIVIPAFNEEGSIVSVLTQVTAHVAELRERYEVDVVVVDDGSSDGTLAALHHFSASYPNAITIVAHERNAGLVAAMRTGALAARADTVVFLDADLSYLPDIIEPLILAKRKAAASAALASPYMPGGHVANVPFVRLAASRAANWILGLFARGRLHTFTGMVRAYDRGEFLALFERTQVGEFNTWAVAVLIANGHRVVEIPAALVWPAERYAAPSRLTPTKLWHRVLLVIETAQMLGAASRQADEHLETGTFALSSSPSSPFSTEP
jgi:glycosyltransferase involved in cell wall biosynthesis